MYKKKSLGQYFLINPSSVRQIVEAADISPEDIVLEIGPGKGALTKKILPGAKKVIVIEKDRRFVEELRKTFAKEVRAKKIIVVEDDALRTNYQSVGLQNGNFKIVANIPYYITGLLLRKILSGNVQPERIVLVVQREVAHRIARDKKGSILSMSVASYGTARYIKTIPREHFSPKPRVDSAILVIENISKNFFKDVDEEKFFEILKKGFSSKRKFLLNNLAELKTKRGLEKNFVRAGISPTARAETLSLEDWKKLTLAILAIG